MVPRFLLVAAMLVAAAQLAAADRQLLQTCPALTQGMLPSTAFLSCYTKTGARGCSGKTGGLCINSCFYRTIDCKPTSAQVTSLFTAWNAALATLEPAKVADMYAPNGVLLPTVSNEVRTTREGLLNYFEHFLHNKPQGVIDQSEVRILDTDVVANMGVYTFTMRASGGKVQARYSYTYKKQVDGRWLITEHHSSQMPEGITDEIVGAFNQWADTLKTEDPIKVAAMYTPNAVLLPTLSNSIANTEEKRLAYFKDFLKKKPTGVFEQIPGSSPMVKLLGPGVATLSGTAKFTLGAANNTVVRVRKTFVWVKVNGGWRVTEHHSSQMPEAV